MRLPKAVAFPDDVHQVDVLKIGCSHVIVPQGRRWDDLVRSGPRLNDDFTAARGAAPIVERARPVEADQAVDGLTTLTQINAVGAPAPMRGVGILAMARRTPMRDHGISRWTGVFGLATVAFWLVQFPLYMAGSAPSVYDGAAYAEHLGSIRTIAFARILLDQGVYVSMMAFAAGFRHLVRQASPVCEWLGTLLFGAAAVWLAVTLVADGLTGAAVLDAISARPDPSVTRSLILGTLLIYNGSTAFVMTALFLGAAGVATLASRVLPAWTGWLALIGALLCLAAVPTMFAGPVDSSRLYNVGGFVPALIANFPPAAWFIVAGILLLRGRAT